ncbi:pentatricopeptide repeat-containing protein At3g12770 [Cryptomeria japonica]|uniref:pentatricopeptide repeat-containing protein At3g12770 n=1 Tax=Cryptomeria japonica TaxID=3369 RepID=UPI0027DA8DEF|nr:pentatricopeptide repeat-containing protein At3g12770 [Cryptomeria japonica]
MNMLKWIATRRQIHSAGTFQSKTYARACGCACVLQRCSHMKQVTHIHPHIVTTGLHYHVFLVTMYVLYRGFQNAHLLVDEIPQPNVDVRPWNSMIREYARSGRGQEAIAVYHEMRIQVIPNKQTFVFVLEACGLQEGKCIHSHIHNYGLQWDLFVATALVGMYAKCGVIETARQVFDRIPVRERDVIAWNAMIAAHGKHGNVDEILSLVRRVPNPTSVTIITLLSAFVDAGFLKHGKLIHGYIIRVGFRTEVSVMNALIDMYAKLGCIQTALQMFDKLSEKAKDVVSWSSMIAGFTQIGQPREALTLFFRMQQTAIQPNHVTLLNILPACAALGALQHIHSYIRKHGFKLDDGSLGSALLTMYAKCGRIDLAWKVFDTLLKKEPVTWNAMIAGYIQNGFVEEPLVLFHQMQLAGAKPDGVTLLGILPACSLQQGQCIHGYSITRGFDSLTCVCNAVIDMYVKCGCLESARQLFDRMSKRDLVSWNTVIAGYAQNGDLNEFLVLFHRLSPGGVMPNVVTLVSILPVCGDLKALVEGKGIHCYIIKKGFDVDVCVMTALVAMYAKCGDTETARQLFDKMSRRDLVSWNALMSGYVQNGHAGDALTLFNQLQAANVKPDSATVVIVLSACAHLGALQYGEGIHAYIIRSGLELHVSVGTAIIDMYGKCGCVDFSFKLFEKMCSRDAASWNAMIAAYGMNGYGENALALFSQMQQVGPMPNHITFICVLSACAHSGLVNEGWQYFDCMRHNYCITPRIEHYACMVDLLGRVGLLNEAHKFIINMPLEPSVSVWGALLFACRIHCNIELGEHVAKLLLELDSQNSGAYLLLSSIYSTTGRWDDATKLKSMIKEKGLVKSPGCSWIAIKGRVHLFLAGEKSYQH